MTVTTLRTTTIVLAALAAVALAVPGHASARRTPPDGLAHTHPHPPEPQTPDASDPPTAAPTSSSGDKPPG
jgi:hypothetical protein